MATADQIKALLQSHVTGDEERFYATALQVAATEARQGHANLARELRTLVDEGRSDASSVRAGAKALGPIPVAQPRGELASLITAHYPHRRMADMVLSPGVQARLTRILREQREHERLRASGLRPRNRVLLVGPPGSGKTLTASVIAGEMALPLFSIQFDGLITKFMGETAAKLRLVFDAIQRTRGVYLFDEFDAIGGNRGLTNDVGEMRRVLNSFLQFLEQETSLSVIVAATNHAELLDRALFRRFDDVIEYGLPSPDLIERAVRAHLGSLDLTALSWPEVVSAAEGLSYAELAAASNDVAKLAVLDDAPTVTSSVLVDALRERAERRSP
ncbi:MAG: ATP-binding protein [Deltaproteobacteria bacterium]|nr:ATP-binding protein [Myxococcales bacterium]MDP3220215.1 ATP-binding protein [Deltaproteobacteria bacterium]